VTDEQLLRQLVEKNYDLAWERVLRADKYRDLPVDEIVQNVFNTVIRLWAQTPPGERVPSSGWTGWVLRITSNELMNANRRAQRDRLRLAPIDEGNLPRQLRHDDDAEQLLDDLALRALLAELSGAEAALLGRIAWQNMTIAEAAAELDMKRGTAEMIVSRFRDKILACWAGRPLKGAKKHGIERFAEALRRRNHD
jgi:RNA polymerase sigma factor (sigma-70 family)